MSALSPETPPCTQLDELCRDHHAWLKGWLRKRLGCEAEAADLAQDTFVRLVENRRLPPLAQPRAFLTTIAKRVMASHFRRREVERAYLESLAALPEPVAPSPEARVLVIEALMRVDALLDGLPARAKTMFLLAQVDGLGYEEIAARLGVSLSLVKQYMARAYRHCYFSDLLADAEGS